MNVVGWPHLSQFGGVSVGVLSGGSATATPMHGRVIKSPCGEFRSAAECSILHRLALAGHRRIKARKGGSHPHGGEVSWIARLLPGSPSRNCSRARRRPTFTSSTSLFATDG